MMDSRGRPLIVVNASTLSRNPAYGHFLMAHECCHHTLGHVRRFYEGIGQLGPQPFYYIRPALKQMELDADCCAVKLLRSKHEMDSIEAGKAAMIAFGASGATPKHRMAQIAAGLGLLPSVIIDQHFQQRNRLGRLLSLIAQNPSLLGLGVDEDTAGVVGPDHVMEVIGRGSITVVDGSASETDAWEIRGHKPLMISGVVLHSLPAGYRFDLRRRHRLRA